MAMLMLNVSVSGQLPVESFPQNKSFGFLTVKRILVSKTSRNKNHTRMTIESLFSVHAAHVFRSTFILEAAFI